MKKLLSLILVITLTLTLFVSCGKAEKALTATELLDLGEKYLLDMDYEQAIVYFNKVIEVEPNNARAYIALAEAYSALGDTEAAVSILQQGLENAEDIEEIEEMLYAIEEAKHPSVTYNIDGSYTEYEYDEDWNVIKSINYYYNADGDRIEQEYDSNSILVRDDYHWAEGSWMETEYNSFGVEISSVYYMANGRWFETEYDPETDTTRSADHYENGACSEQYYVGDLLVRDIYYRSDGSISSWYEYDIEGNSHLKQLSSSDGWTEYEYDSMWKETKVTHYNSDGTIRSQGIYEYDSDGRLSQIKYYDADGNFTGWTEYVYDSEGNLIDENPYDADGHYIK